MLEIGDIGAGDAVDVVHRPDHGITVAAGIRIATTEKSRLPELEPALAFLPVKDQPTVTRQIEKRPAARV